MKVELGGTGLEVTRVGFGGIPIQRLGMGEAAEVVGAALEQGIDFIDTARGYSDSEEKIGRVLSSFGGRVTVATKSFARTRDDMLRDIETSLRNLGVGHIDLYQCHNIAGDDQLETVLGPGGAMEALTEARDQGIIGHIGITGHKPWIVAEAIRRFPFETVQVPFNIIETAAANELLPLAREKRIGTIAMKPVAGGAVRNVLLNLRFILTSGMDVVIPGMDQVFQVEENLSVLDGLSPLSVSEMEVLLREKEDLGDGFCRRCEYCMPCPQGLNISFLHLIGAYYFRYGLRDWAWERLQGLEKKYGDCVRCGECVSKCPYDLNTPAIFAELGRRIAEDRKKN
ncbi:MAG: aldo/keto reductase [Candidatus Fermentibacteraceae bacterium]|nr:aldo/keto reductase [Candidatus Fermentibacteraceae bacterium]MBN2860301.1 aldo/keto reductase [Sphaerochaetaceae bacterium]